MLNKFIKTETLKNMLAECLDTRRSMRLNPHLIARTVLCAATVDARRIIKLIRKNRALNNFINPTSGR